MENKEQKKIAHELGTIYGASVSKNGKWLNVKVMTSHNGETISVNACVPISDKDCMPEGKHAKSDGYKIDDCYYNVEITAFAEKEAPKPDEAPSADDLPF